MSRRHGPMRAALYVCGSTVAPSIDGVSTSNRIDRNHRLEPRANDRDLHNGFAARIHDPHWLLARQWQMGEHQGENASSPVRVDCTTTATPIEPLDGNADFDPTIVPAETLVESELDHWWTMTRRIRAGALFDHALAAGRTLVFRRSAAAL
jgi:hypothetical protein